MIREATARGTFLNLVRAVLNQDMPDALPDGVSADDVLAIAYRQNMLPIAFCALNSMTPRPVSEKWDEYQKRLFSDCVRSEVQMTDYQSLVKYLCENGVRIMPLKGCVIKTLYPAQNLRVMSDVDLLYDGVTTQKLVKLMEKAGYSTEELEHAYHVVFHKKPCVSVELHRCLTADDSPDKAALENMFARAIPDEQIPNLYHMKPEDLYIHVIVHAAKHFRNSGLGVRPMGDIYVLNHTNVDCFDRQYICDRLASVGLSDFEAKLRTTAEAFFGNQQAEVPETELAFFFRGSTYGKGNDKSWEYMEEGGKSTLGFFLHRTFLPYHEMKYRFPVLKKAPYLLPFAWIYRIFDVLLHRRQNVVRVANTEIKREEADNIAQILKSFGMEKHL